MMTTAGLPLTPGYTINIVKDREQAAVILLNSTVAVEGEGGRTYFVTVPQGGEGVVEEVVEDVCSVQEQELVFEEQVCFTEVAREEVVVEEVGEVKPARQQVSGVLCDLCNSRLPTTELAKEHMRTEHNILTYEGPFFKCDFCGQRVTDRVAHMKLAHYSPLAQVKPTIQPQPMNMI